MTSPPVERITEWKMRWLFRKHNIWRKVKRGDLTEKILRSKPAILEAGQILDTKSQSIVYLDALSQQIAKIHQYQHLDGSLGGSGKPDPKQLMIGNIIYHQPKSNHKFSIYQKAEALVFRIALFILYNIDEHITYIDFE
jgi:hypothetical protein